jgi:hypothetical protein
MSENEKLGDFAETYFSADLGKAVPLGLLRAWLSENHFHPEDENGTDTRPVVDSLDLDRWAKSVAVARVVDHGPYGKDKEVWTFFEEGWHKSGCETRLKQERARIGDPTPEGTVFFEPVPPPSFDD